MFIFVMYESTKLCLQYRFIWYVVYTEKEKEHIEIHSNLPSFPLIFLYSVLIFFTVATKSYLKRPFYLDSCVVCARDCIFSQISKLLFVVFEIVFVQSVDMNRVAIWIIREVNTEFSRMDSTSQSAALCAR